MSMVHQALGHTVEFASLETPSSASEDAAPEEVGELRFPLHRLGPARGKYGYAERLVPWLREHRERFDAVIVNGLWQYHGYGCRKALAGSATPYFVFPHGMLDPWFKRRYPLKHLKKWLYWPWADYRVIRDAAATLFTSEEEKLLAAQSFWLYKAHGVVTGLGTTSPVSQASQTTLDEDRQAFLSEYPELVGKRIALFLGRLHPKKGCDLLLQAFASSLAKNTAWHLLMAGPDQMGWQAELMLLAERLGIAERVTWTGLLLEDRKWAALAASEVFVLPSHQENFGVAVAEALALGRPTLISDKVNIWREIAGERAGLVETDTVAGTERMLTAWAGMPEAERLAYAVRARVCFERHFDMRVCAEAVLEAVRSRSRAEL